jgi:membrane glycosyltransferase
MDFASDVTSIAHVIQLSIAPVFLLTAVGAMLGVLSNRLSRAVDRARALEARAKTAPDDEKQTLRQLLTVLSRRIHLIYRAMVLCAVCALLICSVIVTAFASTLAGTVLAVPIAVLFVAAMLAFIGALLLFLREVHLAITTLQIGTP